ncbi:hypothetical protein [Desertivirga arenae]|uniref:hypothetical protein n=1 Tax=Desertivirga arenae TaxID=2810309 RepID=UPI001A95DEA7|nr:hypothetical protein [Pedobacter sp. SYSU D00823]
MMNLNFWNRIKALITPSPKIRYSESVVVPGIGVLFFNKEGERSYWSGHVHNIAVNYEVELRIYNTAINGPTTEQLDEVGDFGKHYDGLKSVLLFRLKQFFLKSGKDISFEDLEKVFYLSRVELSESLQWKIILEPSYKVESSFDFFPQFELFRNRVTWTSFDN